MSLCSVCDVTGSPSSTGIPSLDWLSPLKNVMISIIHNSACEILQWNSRTWATRHVTCGHSIDSTPSKIFQSSRNSCWTSPHYTRIPLIRYLIVCSQRVRNDWLTRRSHHSYLIMQTWTWLHVADWEFEFHLGPGKCASKQKEWEIVLWDCLLSLSPLVEAFIRERKQNYLPEGLQWYVSLDVTWTRAASASWTGDVRMDRIIVPQASGQGSSEVCYWKRQTKTWFS